MYEKWPHGEQTKGWTHVERFYNLDQPEKFRWYIKNWYYVAATWLFAPPARAVAARRRARSPKTDRVGRGAVASHPK